MARFLRYGVDGIVNLDEVSTVVDHTRETELDRFLAERPARGGGPPEFVPRARLRMASGEEVTLDGEAALAAIAYMEKNMQPPNQPRRRKLESS